MVLSHLDPCQYEEMRDHVLNYFSATHWEKQPSNCMTADIEKQVKQQEHTTITMRMALCTGTPV